MPTDAYGPDDNWINFIGRLRHWLRFDGWTVCEAAWILSDLDPDQVRFHPETGDLFSVTDFRGEMIDVEWNSPEGRIRSRRISDALDDIHAIWKSGNHAEKSWTPARWIEWAQEKRISIPWLGYARREGMLPAALLTSDMPEKGGYPGSTAALAARGRDSFYVLILTMAVKGYNYKPDGKSSAVTDILKDAQELGFTISDDTIRNHIKAAARQLFGKGE